MILFVFTLHFYQSWPNLNPNIVSKYLLQPTRLGQMGAVRYPPSNMNRFQEHSELIFKNSLGIYKSAVQRDGNFGALFFFFSWCQSHVEYIVRLKRIKNSVFV